MAGRDKRIDEFDPNGKRIAELNTGNVSGDRPDTAVGYTEIEESDDEFRVHLDLEDAKPEDILVDVCDDHIGIAAHMEKTVELPEATIEKRGAIYREILVPEDADLDSIEATLEDGHLDLIIPKRHAEA